MTEADVMAAWMLHKQGPRDDGTWGCRCGWVQDKPHAHHVADVVAAMVSELDMAPFKATGRVL